MILRLSKAIIKHKDQSATGTYHFGIFKYRHYETSSCRVSVQYKTVSYRCSLRKERPAEGEQNLNTIIEAMKQRRSIRKFKPDMPSRKDIEAVAEAGIYAANGRGKQETITLVVTDKALRDRISRVNCSIGGWDSSFDPFYGAPVILIVLANKNHTTHVYDGSLVMGNMMLAAHSLGLGSIWIHRAREEFEMPEYRQLLKDLGIEGEWEGIAHCALGYADGDIPKAAPRKEGRIRWIEAV